MTNEDLYHVLVGSVGHTLFVALRDDGSIAAIRKSDGKVVMSADAPMAVDSTLSAYERWMVKSNLETIRSTHVTVAEQVALLRANGYPRIAAAVQQQAQGTEST